MKALVISGGGSKGAFAGGIAEYLIQEKQQVYDIFIGTSTGGLLLPHLALGKVDKIKSIYTNVSQNDIFNVNPFLIKQINGEFKTSINHLNTLRAFTRGSETFGESQNLRKLIHKSLSYQEFTELKQLNKKVYFTVSNLSKQKIEYYGNVNCDYRLFCDMAWASANFIPFMSLFKHNNNLFADGGFGVYIPIYQALKLGATDLDIIVLDHENEKKQSKVKYNAFSLLLSTFQFMNQQIKQKDKVIGELISMNNNIDVKIYQTPRKLIENSLIFQPKLMKQWWQEGIEFARSNQPTRY